MKQRELSEQESIGASRSTMRRASLTAGVALALMAALGGFAALGVITPMITPTMRPVRRSRSPPRCRCSGSASRA